MLACLLLLKPLCGPSLALTRPLYAARLCCFCDVQVLDDINETTQQMQQLQDVFANPTGIGANLDEDELLNELEELEATELDAELLQPAPVPTTKVPGAGEKLPSVPQKTKPQAGKTAEELELEALQAEMAL